MYLFSFIILLQALSTSLSFDIELEGVVRLGEDFYKRDIRHSDESLHVSHPINVRTETKLPKKFSRSAIMRATTIEKNRTDELLEYVDHIKKRGVVILKNIGKQTIKEIKVRDRNFIDQIDIVTDLYTSIIQNYFEHVCEEKTKFVIDDELLLLDMVETAYRILYREHRKLLNAAIVAVNTTNNNSAVVERLQRSIQSMSQAIYKQSIKTKREELRHICNKYDVCRPYPALTDYFADFIVEILRLPDHKLEIFVKLMRILAKTNEDFFNLISEKDDREVIISQMSEIFNDFNSVQDTLAVVRAVLTQRFKIINTPNLRLKMRTKAVRLLLDIVDKAFQYEHEDLTSMEFDTTVRAIRTWINNQRPFPESVITRLFNNILKVLEYNLSKNAKKEVSVLLETIIKGSSRNEEIYKTLFTNGSKYVRGEDFHSDLEII